jgi:curved DNA-binding protein CbpA
MSDSLVPFPPEGALDPSGYQGLLTAVHRHRLSGLLLLSAGQVVKKLYLKDGYLSFASSSLPEDRLGDVLLRKGLITREQYDQSSLLIRQTGKRQGTILVQMGALASKDLFRGLILQVTEIAENSFTWREGRYRYQTDYDRVEEMIILKINPGLVIREGLWKRQDTDEYEALATVQFYPGSECPFAEEEINLSPLDRRILSAVRSGETAAALAASQRLPVKVVAKGYAVLSRLGLISACQAPVACPAPEPAAGEVGAPPPPPDYTPQRRSLQEAHRLLPAADHYTMLGLTPSATAEDLKRAYIRRAKEFHPDRFQRPGLDDLGPLAGEVFSRINEAFHVLSDATRRREYDATLKAPHAERKAEGAGDAHIAMEQYKKGMNLLKCGDVPGAVEAFRWAVKLRPEEARCHAALAMALLESGRRLKEAEEHARTAISLDMANSRYHLILGNIYKKGRMTSQATEAFRRALKLDPANEEAKRELNLLVHTVRTPESQPPAHSLLDKLFGR